MQNIFKGEKSHLYQLELDALTCIGNSIFLFFFSPFNILKYKNDYNSGAYEPGSKQKEIVYTYY